jgi:GT2 family glycosyltransferase
LPRDLSIIIVNYRTHDLTKQTIESVINKNHPFKYDIYVVDNASRDGGLEKLEEDFQEETTKGIIKFIVNPENKGFSHANNLAIEESESKYVLLLNSDTEVQGDSLKKCLDYIVRDEKIGALGCKILLPDGSLDKACKRSFPTVSVSFYRMTGLSKLFPKSKRFGQYNLTYLDENGTYEVDSLSGAFMLVRREAINQVGLLDEDFFMYGEDIDWCYRLKQAGWKVVYYGDAQITHYKGGSGRESKALYEFYNAMRIFYDKHYKKKNSVPATAFVYLGIWGVYGLKRILKIFKV